MNSREQILSRKRTNPICNFKIMELIIDMTANSTVNNKQLNTLSWALFMKIKTLSLRGRQLILVSFWAFLGILLPPCTLIQQELFYFCLYLVLRYMNSTMMLVFRDFVETDPSFSPYSKSTPLSAPYSQTKS